MKLKKKNIIFIAVVLVLGVALISKAGYIINLVNYKKMIKEITINEVDMNRVPDGTYNGQCDAFLVAVDVSVTVKDHSIKEIEIVRHDNGRGKPAEVITDKVIQSQSLNVDTVSGCTSSSMVILKSIEDALVSSYKD